MGTENIESCSQRDSAERKGYVRAHRSFNRIWKERDSAEPDLLGKILDRPPVGGIPIIRALIKSSSMEQASSSPAAFKAS